MRILLDHCTPYVLKKGLAPHEVRSTWQMRWDRLTNGQLLAAAAAANFDVFLTIDKGIRHQHNLADLPIKIVLIDLPRNSAETLLPMMPFVLDILPKLRAGQVAVIDALGQVTMINPGRDS